MNTQPIEKLDLRADGALQVHSIFHTIQGEGPFTGRSAIFVRLAGCNLQCPGCDTEYTSKRELYSPRKLLQQIEDTDEYPGPRKPLIVITGGEPFRQNLTPVCNLLNEQGYTVQIETNGTLPPSAGLHDDVHVVCSPKTGKINIAMQARIDSLKYVVKAGEVCKDGLPTRALEHGAVPCVAKPPADYEGPIYIQPMDEKNIQRNARNMQAAVRSCMANGHILQIQVHKVANLE